MGRKRGKSRRNIKEFSGVLYGVPHRKGMILNYLRHAIKQIRRDLKRSGIHHHGLTKILAVKMFCDKHNIEPPATKREYNRWMVEKWLDKDFELLGPITERNYTFGEWNQLRKKVFEKYGKVCMCCNSTKNISADHIKPYSKYPELSLEFDNMQVLCRSCNSKKGDRIIKDYRPLTITTY